MLRGPPEARSTAGQQDSPSGWPALCAPQSAGSPWQACRPAGCGRPGSQQPLPPSVAPTPLNPYSHPTPHPTPLQVVKELKADMPAWVSAYARGGSVRATSARKIYVVVDAISAHFASNGWGAAAPAWHASAEPPSLRPPATPLVLASVPAKQSLTCCVLVNRRPIAAHASACGHGARPAPPSSAQAGTHPAQQAAQAGSRRGGGPGGTCRGQVRSRPRRADGPCQVRRGGRLRRLQRVAATWISLQPQLPCSLFPTTTSVAAPRLLHNPRPNCPRLRTWNACCHLSPAWDRL